MVHKKVFLWNIIKINIKLENILFYKIYPQNKFITKKYDYRSIIIKQIYINNFSVIKLLKYIPLKKI
jgi:hypothetical protein